MWQAAVELAREHGVYSVAHPLRLDYTGLKKRLAGVSHRRRKARKPAFVVASSQFSKSDAPRLEVRLVDIVVQAPTFHFLPGVRLFRKAGNPPDHDGVLDVLAVAGPDSIPMENPDPSVLLTLLLGQPAPLRHFSLPFR